MPVSKCRKFTVADGMILIAATAVELSLLSLRTSPLEGYRGWELGPSLLKEFGEWSRAPLPVRASTWRSFASVVVEIVLGLTKLWLVPTIAVFMLRLRQPRPSIRRLVRQPGFAATLAVVLVWAITSLVTIPAACERSFYTTSNEAAHGYPTTALEIYYYENSGSHRLEVAVLVVWSFLLVGKLTRSEAGWIDRLGRVVGGGWLVLFVIELVYYSFLV